MGILSVLGLLKNVPKLVKAVTGGDKDLASKAIEVAKVVTGANDEKTAVEALNADPDLRYQYEMRLLEDKHIPDRLNLENTQGARDMYKTFHEKADHIADRIMTWNLPAIIVLVIINIAVVLYLKDQPELIAIVSGFIGSEIRALGTERMSVVNFFFGSSMGSKTKDKK